MSTDAERWKALDAASYDDVADRFDRHSSRLSAGAAADLLRLCAIGPDERVLDVGTGTGLLPFELLRTVPAVGAVVGIDISSGMIQTARGKAQRSGNPESRLRFERMDAERLDFPDAAFDVVLSAFALTHVPHPDRALREMYRVLRPGGRVAIAVGSRPPLGADAVTHTVRELGRLRDRRRGRLLAADLLERIIVERCGAAPADLPRGSTLSRRLSRAGVLGRLVRDAGFVDLRRRWRNYQNVVHDPDEYWDLQRIIRSDARKRLLDARPDVVEDIRVRFLDACRRALAAGGSLTYPISAVFFVARKPDTDGAHPAGSDFIGTS